MSNEPAAFKQIDVTRALKGALAAGVEVAEFRINAAGEIQVSLAGREADQADEIMDAIDRD